MVLLLLLFGNPDGFKDGGPCCGGMPCGGMHGAMPGGVAGGMPGGMAGLGKKILGRIRWRLISCFTDWLFSR